MQLQRVRIVTTLLTSVITPPVYALVAYQACSRGVYWVAGCAAVGLALSLRTAWAARRALRAPAEWRPPRAITAFLVLFISAVVLTGYGGGYGAAWALCAPPLALLVHGTCVGSAITIGMFGVLVVGLTNPSMVSSEIVAEPFRLRIGIAYVVIAAACIASSGATDWFSRRLGEAHEEIHSLRALLTMCAHCKRVRVDGEWDTIERYLDREQQLRLSHGVCDLCAKEHYAEIMEP